MTQVVRQKRVLLLTSVNVVLAVAVIAVVAVGLSNAHRGAQEAAAQREAELREELEGLRVVRAELASLREVRPELAGLRAELHGSIDELRRTQQAPPVDSQLTQTLQLVASEQQLLLLRSLKPPGAAPPHRVTQRSARRPRRSLRSTGCAVPK